MNSFENLNLPKQLRQAIDDLGFAQPTPIQEQAFPVILSGTDMVGIAQTGTGKTMAYMLPLLQQLKFSNQLNPRILIILPTRELVMQVVENVKTYTQYMSVRTLGIYGEANIKLQIESVNQGIDILVATPGRLYDLIIKRVVILKDITKLVIDEVDVMLDLGFRPQLINIFDLLPTKRQNIMFSATMTNEVDDLLDDFFNAPARVYIAPSGSRLENIEQQAIPVKNFLTKVNLLAHLLADKQVYHKVLVFITNKKLADRLLDQLQEKMGTSIGVIHSNKSQNQRIRAVQEFESGEKRILIATDLISRGLDFEKVSHVISFDTPEYPENYMHRIGRTGRATEMGRSLLFFTEKEAASKETIEALMDYTIPLMSMPEEVEIVNELIDEEREVPKEKNYLPQLKKKVTGPSTHEKLEKNLKVNEGGSYKKKLAEKYKKPQTRGDKFAKKKTRRR